MAERQMATDLTGIRRDHLARYEWARPIVKDQSVLDAACGCGYGTHVLSQSASEVCGMDNSAEAIAYAEKHWNSPKIMYERCDLENGAYGNYDTVVCFETVEHLRNPASFLRFCRENADKLLISAPNEEGLRYEPTRFPFHHRHYTYSQMEMLLAENGWRLGAVWHQKGAHSDVEPSWHRMARTLVYLAE